MKHITLGIPATTQTGPRTATSRVASRSFGPPILTDQHKQKMAANGENQLSQRVMLRIRANAHVAVHGKEAIFKVTTVSVNQQGALVVMERSLPPDTRLILENSQTRERVACRVTRPAREIPEGYQVPIEFDSPAPDFWKIAFPPADWRPSD